MRYIFNNYRLPENCDTDHQTMSNRVGSVVIDVLFDVFEKIKQEVAPA